jgi:hypothetical protein
MDLPNWTFRTRWQSAAVTGQPPELQRCLSSSENRHEGAGVVATIVFDLDAMGGMPSGSTRRIEWRLRVRYVVGDGPRAWFAGGCWEFGHR